MAESVRMTTATTALLAAAGLPHVEALLPHCRHQRTSLYCALHHDQVPLWLLEAFAGWYEKNSPLAPEERDLLFRRLLYDLWPKPPVEPGSRRGRKQPPRGSFTTHAKNSLAASPAGLKGRTPTPTPTQTASAAAIRGTAPPGDGSAGRRDYVGGGANAAAGGGAGAPPPPPGGRGGQRVPPPPPVFFCPRRSRGPQRRGRGMEAPDPR